MRKCHREFRQKSKSVPTESWGTFVGYCVPQLIAVCVIYTEIKISALFELVRLKVKSLKAICGSYSTYALKVYCTLTRTSSLILLQRRCTQQAARETSASDGRNYMKFSLQFSNAKPQSWDIGQIPLTPPKEGMLRIFTSVKSNGFGQRPAC
jgi:hypothetical protein